MFSELVRMIRVGWVLVFAALAMGAPVGGAEKKGGGESAPRRDPVDQPFRAAPMNVAPRSVAVPLAEDLHIAFDPELLRTHVAWHGPSLNLNGSPYRGQKVPFYCDFDGEALWTNPAVFPWAIGSIPSGEVLRRPDFARYRGISTKPGTVTFMYELTLPSGERVRIHETPRRVGATGLKTIVRRLEVGPSSEPLWFLAHAEDGATLRTSPSGAVGFQRQSGGNLALVARGVPGLEWNAAVKDVDYVSNYWTEKKNDTELRKVRTQGAQARAWLRIPPHTEDIAIEVASIIVDSRNPGAVVATPVAPPNLGAPFDASPGVDRIEPRVATPPKEEASRISGNPHYRIEHFRLPEDIDLQVTGLDFLADGRLAVCTWLGEIYLIENVTGAPSEARYRRYARGLCEPGGLSIVEGEMYVVQKGELTRIRDTDNDGEADLFECINQDWGFTGNYHDFSFGPVVDGAGNFYVWRNGNRGIYEVPYMGWGLRIGADGSTIEGVSSGFRSPNGFGSYQGDLFMADNQGNWIGTCTLNHVKPGRFYGFPSTRPAPREQFENPQERDAPAIWFPYKLSASTSDIKEIEGDGFGPFQGQLVVGDWKNSNIMRVQLEKVGGEWQGCVWPLARGFWSGVNRFAFGPDGKLYVGGCKNRAWAALGPYESSLDRVSWTGKVPFEVHSVQALKDGFELTFTQPVDAATAADPLSYDLLQYRYKYHQDYGSPEFDHDGKANSRTAVEVTRAVVSQDRRTVRLGVQGWKEGYVTLIRALDVENGEGDLLVNDTLYYTLNRIPGR